MLISPIGSDDGGWQISQLEKGRHLVARSSVCCVFMMCTVLRNFYILFFIELDVNLAASPLNITTTVLLDRTLRIRCVCANVCVCNCEKLQHSDK